MGNNIQRIERETFKQIFRNHWEAFQQRYHRYQREEVHASIEKMLRGGDPASGYNTDLFIRRMVRRGSRGTSS
jgi:hypothetical protein